MSADSYIIVRNQALSLDGAHEILVPMSHPFDNATEALTWMVSRGMQSTFKVISQAKLSYANAIKNINSWATGWSCLQQPDNPAPKRLTVVKGGKE